MRRVGILGGTFNPVHCGHIRLALEMAEAVGLDAVEFVPAARPPHKADCGLLDFEFRSRLVSLAIGGIAGFSLNTMEADRPGPSYTWDTLTDLVSRRPGDEFFFIMGASDLLSLHLWKRGLELPSLVNLAVSNREHLGRDQVTEYFASRPGAEVAPDGEGGWRSASGRTVSLVDIPRLDISASFIRDRFRRSRNLRCLLPAPVEEQLLGHRERVLAAWA